MINFELIVKYLPLLLKGAITTLHIAAMSCFLGLTGGTLLALGQTQSSLIHASRLGKLRWAGSLLNYCISFYITIIRGTPMLIQIAFFYYAIIPALGLQISPLYAAIIAIGINSSAYISQVIRSGITSVDKGQLEAARVLGFSKMQSIRYIVLPQALRMVIPSLGNEFITLIKDSSLAYTIGVVELYKQGITMKSLTFDTMTTFTAVALIYLILTTVLSFVMNVIERKMNQHVKN